MRDVRWLNVLAAFGLAAGYYLLASLVIERMPFALLPAWLKHASPSDAAALATWFAMLNAVGALVAALPTAFVLGWKSEKPLPLSLAAALITAVTVVLSGWAEYGPPTSSLRSFNDAFYFFSLLLALPFWSRLVSHWRGAQSPGRAHA